MTRFPVQFDLGTACRRALRSELRSLTAREGGHGITGARTSRDVPRCRALLIALYPEEAEIYR